MRKPKIKNDAPDCNPKLDVKQSTFVKITLFEFAVSIKRGVDLQMRKFQYRSWHNSSTFCSVVSSEGDEELPNEGQGIATFSGFITCSLKVHTINGNPPQSLNKICTLYMNLDFNALVG